MSSNIKDKMFTDNQEEEKYDYPDPLEPENFKRIIRADKDHFILKTFLKGILKFEVIHIEDIGPDYFVLVKNEKGEYWCYYVTVGNANFMLNGMKIVIKD